MYVSLALRAGQPEQVVDVFERVTVSRVPDEWRHRLLLYAAEAYWAQDELETAEELYREVLSAPPEISSVAYQRLFMAAQQREDDEALRRIIRQAETELAGMPSVLKEFWLRIGIESYRDQKPDLSESYLQRVWDLRESHAISGTVPLYLAALLDDRGDTDAAIEVLEAYLTKEANQEHRDLVLLRLGNLYVDTELWDLAADRLERFLGEYPASALTADAGYLYVYTLYRQNRYRDALERIQWLFDEARTGSHTFQLLRMRALLHRLSGDDQQAVSTLRSYIPLNREDIGARLDLVKILFQMDEYRDVIREVESMTGDFPDLNRTHPGAYLAAQYLVGLSHIALKDYAPAVAALQVMSQEQLEQHELATIYPYALFYHGWSLYRLNEYRDAVTVFRRFTEYDPGHELSDRAHYLAGWCAYSAEDYETASEFFSALVHGFRSTPLEDKGRFLLAKSLAAEEKNEEAAMTFQTLYVDGAESAFSDDARFEHANLLLVMGREEQAVKEYYELYQRFPRSPLAEEALYKRGEILYGGGEYHEARDAFYLYRQSFPRGKLVDAALYWGGLAAASVDETFGALLLWEKLIDQYLESPFRSDAIHRSAEIYAESGDFRKALSLYTEMLAVYPDEAAAVEAENRADELRYLLLGLSDREAELSATIGREGGARTTTGREALVELARLYIYEGAGKQDLAVSMLNDVIKHQDEDPESAAQAQYLIGEYHFRQGNLNKAGNAFLDAALMNPSDRDHMAQSMYRAAEMTQLAGNDREARALVDRIVENFPYSQWAEEGRKLLENE
jgi:TolA-binding protein